MNMDDLVFVQVYCTDLSLYDSSTPRTAPSSQRIFRLARSSAQAPSFAADISKMQAIAVRH